MLLSDEQVMTIGISIILILSRSSSSISRMRQIEQETM